MSTDSPSVDDDSSSRGDCIPIDVTVHHAQQETADLPGAKKFAGCFLSGTRQRNSLPGARPGGTRQIKASGKAAFAGCRALGKFQPSAKIGLYGCRPLGKIWPPAKVAGLTAASCRQPLPGATPLGTRQRIFLFFLNFFAGCPMTWHPAKASLPGARGGTRQIIIFFIFLTPFFLWGLATVNISLFQNLGQL